MSLLLKINIDSAIYMQTFANKLKKSVENNIKDKCYQNNLLFDN
jgi:hypothetical protein